MIILCTCKYPELESELKNWIVEQRIAGSCLDGFRIVAKAMQLATIHSLDTFRGSRGWLYNFLKRNKLVLRYILIYLIALNLPKKMQIYF